MKKIQDARPPLCDVRQTAGRSPLSERGIYWELLRRAVSPSARDAPSASPADPASSAPATPPWPPRPPPLARPAPAATDRAAISQRIGQLLQASRSRDEQCNMQLLSHCNTSSVCAPPPARAERLPAGRWPCCPSSASSRSCGNTSRHECSVAPARRLQPGKEQSRVASSSKPGPLRNKAARSSRRRRNGCDGGPELAFGCACACLNHLLRPLERRGPLRRKVRDVNLRRDLRGLARRRALFLRLATLRRLRLRLLRPRLRGARVQRGAAGVDPMPVVVRVLAEQFASLDRRRPLRREGGNINSRLDHRRLLRIRALCRHLLPAPARVGTGARGRAALARRAGMPLGASRALPLPRWLWLLR